MKLNKDNGRYTAFHAGQSDYLKGIGLQPALHGIEDDFRREQYLAGYRQEAKDFNDILKSNA